MTRAADEEQITGISIEPLATPGVLGFHELRARKTGDMRLYVKYELIEPFRGSNIE
ncbi:MAG: hypothetical protein JSS57_16895 [Proteobacteria bacterium]|nr:hypothetical protein [Pseudomonadota bacterium]